MLGRILKEPLLHFFVLGSALFFAFSIVSEGDERRDGEIVVSSRKIEQLARLFERTWQRPPSEAELEGLVDDWIREEAAYREALRLGLDRDDAVLRRRLRQKIDFMAEGAATLAEPSEEQLRAYLEENDDAFRVDPRLSFRQVYLARERGNVPADEAKVILTRLRRERPVDASALGDPTLLDHAYPDVGEREIAALFGSRFAAALVELPVGSWEGPVESGYGHHLVIVDARQAGRLPDLAEVREQVRRDWQSAQRESALEAFYRELVGRHRVVVEWPASEAAGARP